MRTRREIREGRPEIDVARVAWITRDDGRIEMSILEANQRKVRSLGPAGIWLFIVGRVLAAFGLGILAMSYFPAVAFPVAIPVIVIGVALLAIAPTRFAQTPIDHEK